MRLYRARRLDMRACHPASEDRRPRCLKRGLLGDVDKFEPVPGGGEVYHAEEAVGQLIIARGDGAVDLEVAEHALDAVALLVERPVMLNLHAAVRPARDNGRDIPLRKVGADRIGVVALVGKQGIGGAFGQDDQGIVRLAVCRFAARQVEGERSPEGIGEAVKLTGEPAPRAAKSASMSPPFPPAAETWARTVVLSML